MPHSQTDPLSHPTIAVSAVKETKEINFFVKTVDPVVFDFNDLLSDKDLSEQIERAFGQDSLGLCLVKNLPVNSSFFL